MANDHFSISHMRLGKWWVNYRYISIQELRFFPTYNMLLDIQCPKFKLCFAVSYFWEPTCSWLT